VQKYCAKLQVSAYSAKTLQAYDRRQTDGERNVVTFA